MEEGLLFQSILCSLFLSFFLFSSTVFSAEIIENSVARVSWGPDVEINTPAYFNSVFGSIMEDITGDGVSEIILTGEISRCGSRIRADILSFQASSSNVLQLADSTNQLFTTAVIDAVRNANYAANIKSLGRHGISQKNILLSGWKIFRILKQRSNFTFDIEDPANYFGLQTGSSKMAVADFNGDGNDDIILGQDYIFGNIPMVLYSQFSNGSLFNNSLEAFSLIGGGPTRVFKLEAGLLFPNQPASLLYIKNFENATILRNVGGGNGSVLFNNYDVLPYDYFRGPLIWKDFDNDGYQDIFYTGSENSKQTTILFRNAKNGSFTQNVIELPGEGFDGCANAGDIDLDGDLDLIISGTSSWANTTNLFLQNDGNGNFTFYRSVNLPSTTGLCRALIGTFPNNQQRMAVVGQSIQKSQSIGVVAFDGFELVDTLAQTFQKSVLYTTLYRARTNSLSAIDANGDGCLDLAYSSSNIVPSYPDISDLLYGFCNGSFSRSPSNPLMAFSPSILIWEDFNMDGFVDLFQLGTNNNLFRVDANYRLGSNSGIFTQLSIGPPTFIPGFPDFYDRYNPRSAISIRYSDQYCPDIFIIRSRYYQEFVFLTLFQCVGNGSFLDVSNSSHIVGEDILGYNSVNLVSFQPFLQNSLTDAIVAVSNDTYLPPSLDIFYLSSLNNRSLEIRNFNSRSLTALHARLFVLFASADFTGDGLNDLVYLTNGSFSGSSMILKNLGNRTFVQIGANNPFASIKATTSGFLYSTLKVFDYDSDGNLDLMYSETNPDEFSDAIYFFHGQGNMSFVEATASLSWIADMKVSGLFVVDQFTNALDNITDFFFSGGNGCGISLPLRKTVPTLTNASSSTGASPQEPNEESGSQSSAVDLAAVISGSVGGAGAILVVVLGCCCCFIAMMVCCMAFLMLMVLVVLAAVFIVSITGAGFLAADIGIMAVLVKRSGVSRNLSFLESNAVAIENCDINEKDIRRAAEVTSEVRHLERSSIRITRKLGAGAYGDVLLGEWNGVEVAVKTIRTQSIAAIEDFQHEALMMAKVSHHPCIVELVGISMDGDRVALVMRYYSGGSLDRVLQKRRIDSRHKLQIAHDMAAALAFLHSLGIVHRDVAARNVLLDGSGRSKLADLGMSRTLVSPDCEQQTNSSVGPIRWMAPESISSRVYSSATDAYAFAMLMYEMWSDGKLPFHEISSLTDVALKILREEIRPSIPDDMPVQLERLMRTLWATDPSKRPTMDTVVLELRTNLNHIEHTGFISEPSIHSGISEHSLMSSTTGNYRPFEAD